MRSFLIALVVLGTACVTSAPRDRYDGRYDDRQSVQVFDATTTDGMFVRVQQDRRSGDMLIVEPASMSGQHAVMVNPNGGSGMPLVAIGGPTYQRRDDSARHDDYGRARDDVHR
jgi:hypothetical protein